MAYGFFLSLKDGPEGPTYYLQGEPIRPGLDLELRLEGDVWILGRFEWSGRKDEAPTFHLTCGGAWEEMADPESSTYPIPPEISFEIPRGTLFRLSRATASIPPEPT